MAEKTVAERLRLQPGMTAALLHAPHETAETLGIPSGVTLTDDPAAADFVLLFAESQAEAESRITELAPKLSETTVAWVAYPKGSKAAGYDISRDTVAAFVRTQGLVVVANFSIDAKWSALRVRSLKPGE